MKDAKSTLIFFRSKKAENQVEMGGDIPSADSRPSKCRYDPFPPFQLNHPLLTPPQIVRKFNATLLPTQKKKLR